MEPSDRTDASRTNRTPTERRTDATTDRRGTMTDRTTTTTTETDRRGTDDRPTLADLSHTNPYTGEVFGATQMYSRGRTVAADGGERDADPRTNGVGTAAPGDEEEDEQDVMTMADVAHEPPGDADGAQAAYDRGATDE